MNYSCVVCRKSIATDFSDVGLQVEAHVFDLRRGWPHRHPGTEEPGTRPILQAHEGPCTSALLEHLAKLDRAGLAVMRRIPGRKCWECGWWGPGVELSLMQAPSGAVLDAAIGSQVFPFICIGCLGTAVAEWPEGEIGQALEGRRGGSSPGPGGCTCPFPRTKCPRCGDAHCLACEEADGVEPPRRCR